MKDTCGANRPGWMLLVAILALGGLVVGGCAPAGAGEQTAVPTGSVQPTRAPTRPATPMTISLRALAPNSADTRWVNGAGTALPFGATDPIQGYARLETLPIEDGQMHDVLTMHPPAAGEVISGCFDVTIPDEQARFSAAIAYVDIIAHGGQIEPQGDGVTYQVLVHTAETGCGSNGTVIAAGSERFDGQVSAINVDLADFAGQRVTLELRVAAGANNVQDWSVWLEPAITGQRR